MERESQVVETGRATLGPIGQFAAKTAIVLAAAIVLLWVAVIQINAMVNNAMGQLLGQVQGEMKNFSSRAFWAKVELELERQANSKSELPPEKREKILAEIRTISDHWRPFVLEIADAVAGNKKPSPTR